MADKNIKVILFDMVGVLLFIKKNFSPITKDEINASNIESLYNHTDDKKLLIDIKDKLNLDEVSLEKALECLPKKFEKFEALWKILSKLKEKYDLAVINNGNALAMKYWQQDFDFSIFNFFINSAQEGIKKPDPKIYLLTCQKLAVSPENCLFMDDTLENVQTADDLGMTTLWWNKDKSREENLKQFLELIKFK
jgi:epoxide hydrolase-like predicted phosphatase